MARTRIDIKRKADDSLYSVVDYSVKGRYPRVGLRTKDIKQARRRLTALETTTDTEEAKRRIAFIADADDQDDERRRIADLLRGDMLIPSVSLDEARDELANLTGEEIDDATARRWQHAYSIPKQATILYEFGYDDSDILSLVDGVKSKLGQKINPDWARKHPDRKHEAWGKLFGIEPERFRDKTVSEHRLSDCLPEWVAEKKADRISSTQIKAVENVFKKFIDRIGDKSLNRLVKSDFVGYEDHLKAIQGPRTNKWFVDQCDPIRRVLQTARDRVDWDDEFPDGLDNWTRIKKSRRAYKASPSNRRKLPAEQYAKLLAQAEAWKAIDLAEYAATLPVKPDGNVGLQKANNIKQTKRVKRAGTMWSAILRLVANCGLDSVDVSRITWGNLKLDGKTPHMDFPRTKSEHQTGAAVPRLTPLLPSTVVALRDWRAYEPDYTATVFRNDGKKGFVSAKVWTGFKKLREVTGVTNYSPKHLRNIGPTVGRNGKRPKAERQAFLGHEEDGTNVFYEEHLDNPTYLRPKISERGGIVERWRAGSAGGATHSSSV